MEINPRTSKKALLATFGLILLAIVLAFFAPEEKTLGSYIRLIYIHAAVTMVGLVMFAVSGLLGVVYFVGLLAAKNPIINKFAGRIVTWSSSSQLTAILFWTASVSLGSISAYLTWGGSWWVEPRLRVALFILVLGFVIYQLRQMVEDKALRAGLNISLPAISVLMLTTTGKLVHPNNAFAKSDSVEIKLFAALITLVFAIVAVILTQIFSKSEQRSNASVELAAYKDI